MKSEWGVEQKKKWEKEREKILSSKEKIFCQNSQKFLSPNILKENFSRKYESQDFKDILYEVRKTLIALKILIKKYSD